VRFGGLWDDKGDRMDALVTIVGGLAIAFAARAFADWKARRAVRNTFYMVRPKKKGD